MTFEAPHSNATAQTNFAPERNTRPARRSGSKGSSGHLEVARTAQDAGVGKLVLTHLRPHMDAPGVHERMIDEM